LSTKIKQSVSDREFAAQTAEKYYDEIYLFLCRRCGNPDDAKDICQNTFVKFAGAAKSYKERNKLRSYLFKIAVNCCNDYYRCHTAALPLEAAGGLTESYLYQPQYKAEKKEESIKVQCVLSSLPVSQRDVLILRYYHDMKPREIAACLNIPVATVKTRLFRAKASFLKEWDND